MPPALARRAPSVPHLVNHCQQHWVQHCQQHAAAIAAGIRQFRLQEAEEQKQQLSITPSQASWAKAQEAARRHATPLCYGLRFHVTNQPGLPRFSWPRGATGSEDEVAGYDEAQKWLQQHVCPTGVKAVVVASDEWLEW